MTKHGMVGTRLYNSWRGMKQRCLNPRHKDYMNYGGRGIEICDAWMQFSGFADWALKNGYASNLTIDRTDPNGNYCPKNCSWKTNVEQMNNKRNNIKIKTDSGGVATLGDFCRENGVRYGTAQMQYYRGKTVFLTREPAEAELKGGIALNDCKYCKATYGSGEPLTTAGGAKVYIYRDATGAYLMLNNRTVSKVKIKACPMCGEVLSV